jgi:hypothetical protein
MAVTMLDTNPSDLKTQTLEHCIRIALEAGELSPSLEAQIHSLTTGQLSDSQQKLLYLLEDAIREGCILLTHRVSQ